MIRPINRLARWLRQPWLRSGAFVIGSFLMTILFFVLASLPSPQPGISGLALEFPGTANTALAILRSFQDARLLDEVVAAVLWDLALIVTYVTAYVALLEWLDRIESGSRDELLPHAIQGVLIAGGLDVFEDGGILFLVAHVGNPEHAFFGIVSLITTLFAMIKWTLLVAVTGYVSWELVRLIGRESGSGNSTPRAPLRARPTSSERVRQPEVRPGLGDVEELEEELMQSSNIRRSQQS